MKFNVPSKALYSFVTSVSKVINSKNAITVLNNFYFELSDGLLVVKASDTENTLIGRIEVSNVEGKGSFCIDARRMIEMLREMPDQGITFTIDDETLEVRVTYSTGFYNTVAISGAEYPVVDIYDTSAECIEFTAPVKEVIAGIEYTLFAVSSDEMRPQMTGILWDIKTDRIIFVATDTRKLVRYTNSVIMPQVEGSFILPYKPASVIRNVFAGEEPLNIKVSARSVQFSTNDFTLDCRLIKGNFPDYNRVIPAKNPYTVTLERATFLTAVKRVNAFVDANNGRITFSISSDRLVMRAQDSSYNTSGEESVPCEYTGKDMMIAFSGPFLIEILQTLPTDDIEIHLADQSRTAVFMPAENAPGTDLLVLLMPMHI